MDTRIERAMGSWTVALFSALAATFVLASSLRAATSAPAEALEVPGLAKRPTLDAVLAAGEWSSAAAVDITNGGAPVTLYLAHRGVELYVAVDDGANPVLGPYDRIALHFDDEGGVPPVLSDGMYGNPACGPPHSGEGVYILYYEGGPRVAWEEWIVGPQGCGVQFNVAGVPYSVGDSGGHVVFEAALPIEGRSALVVGAGQTIGFFIWTLDAGTGIYTGAWPPDGTVYVPATYAQLTLDGLLFADGFEAGGTSWWSLVAP